MNKPTTFPTPHLSASEAEGRTDRSGWTYADYLAEARARQPADGINSKFMRVTNEELAVADAMISWRLVSARRRAMEKSA